MRRLVPFLFAILGGCARSGGPGSKPASRPPTWSVHAPSGGLRVSESTWRLCYAPADWMPRRLSDRGRRILARLRMRRCCRVQLSVGSGWVLLSFPVEWVYGRALDVVGPPAGPWAVVDRSARTYRAGRPEQVLALLEGRGDLTPRVTSVRFLDDKPEPSPGLGSGVRRLEMVLERELGAQCRQIVGLTLWHRSGGRAASSEEAAGLLAMVGIAPGDDLLRGLVRRLGEPVAIRMESRCRSWPAQRKAVALAARRLLGPSDATLPAHRIALPPPEAEYRTGPLSGAGALPFSDSGWHGLVSWSGQPDAGFCPLALRNRTAWWVVVFSDGVPLASLASGASATPSGLPCGYHRLSATTPFGSLSWGPVDTYVAGVWTLR